jgi:hypothetical protein
MAKAFEIGEVVLFQREAGARWEHETRCRDNSPTCRRRRGLGRAPLLASMALFSVSSRKGLG